MCSHGYDGTMSETVLPATERLDCGGHAVFSRPADERAGTDLVLVLHGYGSNERRAAARMFPMLPAHCTGLALRGGFEIDAAATEGLPADPGAWGWFLLDLSLKAEFTQVLAAVHRVYDVLADPAVADAGFRSVSVLGFSQGMAMATTAVRVRPEAFACAVGLGGFVVDDALLATLDGPAEGPGPRPFFWGRDPADPVIHDGAIAATDRWAQQHTRLTARTYPEAGHAISAEMVRDVRIFLEHTLGRVSAG